MTRLQLVAAVVLVLVVLATAGVLARERITDSPMLAPIGMARTARAPEGVRIRVQVLNATTTRGLARRATRLLRERGFDVVEMGTADAQFDTTLVLDRSNHPEWAAAVAEVLEPARAVSRPDSSRYLDVTVLIGRTWRAPAEPLDP